MSDNISLKYLFHQHNLNSRQVRWLSFLSKYDFEIKHIKGKDNKVVDALSRNTNLLYASSNYESNLENKIPIAENFDKEYQNLKEKATENERNQIKIDLSLNIRGLLLHKGRLYIPNSTYIKVSIMNELYKRPYSRHPGYHKMITMTRKYLFWPNMMKEVAEHLACCIECQ